MENIISLLTPKSSTFYMEFDSTVRQALEKFDAHKFSVYPLVDELGKYQGSVSEGDLLRFIKNQNNFNLKLAENFKVKDVDKYRPYRSVTIEATMEEVLNLSLEQNFIPVVDDNNTFIGIIKRREVITYLMKVENE